MSTKKKRQRKEPRHVFRFKVPSGLGRSTVIAVPVKTKKATKQVTLILTAEHVQRSIDLKGVGNTQTCSAAICVKSHEDAFPHPIVGIVDWTYSRAYVVTKMREMSKDAWMPTECVVYKHDNGIAHLNDSPGGQRKLLKMLEAEGDIAIKLLPLKRKKPQATGGRPVQSDGSRSGKATGALLRFAQAQAGLGEVTAT